MSGKTFLLNTSHLVSDLSLLVGEWFIVAQTRDRIPLPWSCLFGTADLRPCQMAFLEEVGVDGVQQHVPRKFGILNPSISIREAKANLANARAVFERLAGDAQAGARRWQEAMASLDELPLGYLTIDPTKLLVAQDLATGAAAYAAAFAGGQEGLVAKRALARLDPAADADANFEALDGGFLEVGRYLRRTRSAEEAREIQARLATLESGRPTPRAGTARSPAAIAPSPAAIAPLPAQNPPENFWADAGLLEQGRRHAEVVVGPSLFMGARRYYSLSLTNRSRQPMRVRQFAGFARPDTEYVLATGTGQWLTGEQFVDWYGAPAGGWIAPGQTVAQLAECSGDQDESWAYWCEDSAHAPFMATARAGKSSTGGRMNGDGWMLGVPVEALGADTTLVRRELDTLIERLVATARDRQGRTLTRDLDGLRWLDETIEELHREGDRRHWGKVVPMFGAFLGDVILGTGQGAGSWVRCGETLCVQAAGATFLPFQKVIKRLVEGRGSDTSILGIQVDSRPAPVVARLPNQVRETSPDPEMASALTQLRSALAQRRATMHPRTLAGIAGERPEWMKPNDGLREAVDRQGLLLAEGTVVWASLVQANKLLFKPGPSDCPAQVVYARDSELDARPMELRAIAQRIFKLKSTTPSDPQEKAIAARVTNEMDRTMGWPLPVELTARKVFSAAIMIYRKHIPAGVLSGASFPVLVHPDTQAVMMVPVEFWPMDLVRLWKKGSL